MSNPFIGKQFVFSDKHDVLAQGTVIESEENENGQVRLFVDCPNLLGSPLDSFLYLNSDLFHETEGQWVALRKDSLASERVLAQGNLQLV